MQARHRANAIKSICAYCQGEFLNEGYFVRQCCDRSCAMKLTMEQKTGRIPWSPAELDLLESIAGTVPRHEIEALYNRRAARRGFPKRGAEALKIRLSRMNLSQQATEDNWKASTLANLLGIHRDRVRVWMHGRRSGQGSRSGGLLPYRKVSNITAINKKDFVEFARRYPEKLQGIHPRNLALVINDRKLVAQIAAAGRPTCGYSHELVCVETGQKFRSAKEAGRRMFMKSHHILRQTRAGKKAYGYTFKILEVGSPDYSHLADQFHSKSAGGDRSCN